MNIKYPIEDTHTFSVAEILAMLETDAKLGLSHSESGKRNTEFGLNIYPNKKHKSIWLIFLLQFKSPIVYLLIFGALVSLYFKDYLESISILVVILVNALIGFWMELQARSSMNALKKMDIIHSKVIRNGKIAEIPSEKITLGDLVIFEAGDLIPGDGRLVMSNQLQCDESSLTGESLPSPKNTELLPLQTPLGDRVNMVFKGTSVINGNGKAIITGIAQNTQLGTINTLLDNAQEKTTPLDVKIAALSKKLIWITLFMTAVFAISGIIQGKKAVLIIETSIALAVAAFPEGLPIVATVALAYGMLLMAKRNATVKKLSSVETLGSTSVILTDKTGTLTENKIHVETLDFPEEKFKIHIEKNELIFENTSIKKSKGNFEKLRVIAALCNNAHLKNLIEKKKEIGDPIEIALLQLVNTSEPNAEALKKQYSRVAEIPFSAETKMMGTLHENIGSQFVAAKGSVEDLLEKCKDIQYGTSIQVLNVTEKKAILLAAETMAKEGLRVLAFAYKEEKELAHDDFLYDLVYVGMIGFLDPPRADIQEAIITCRNAGIKIVMITGDHPQTALNIAKKIGLVDEDEQTVMTGKEIPEITTMSSKWKQRILETAVFARTTPKQKLEIASIFQEANHIVAMTGDGVNDAPALKKADVGIAMGLRGTQVAKEAASIVLKDDSFTAIADAVAFGRTIFQNIQKFVIYLVSCNLSEIFIVTVLGFMAPASTLLPLQILFLNMVTDIFPALALGLGKGDSTVMEKAPRNPKKDIISTKSWLAIAMYSFTMTLAVMIAVLYCSNYLTSNSQILNNVAFLTLAFAQLFHVFNMSSVHSRFLVNDITKNKYVWFALLICFALVGLVYALPQMRLILDLTLIPGSIWMVVVLSSLLPLVLVQFYKLFKL